MLKPCRGCGRPSSSARCHQCERSADKARGTRGERGYGGAYGRARARLREAFTPGDACVICHLPIESLADWTAEHIMPLRDGGSSDLGNLGNAHSWCNYGWRRSSN